MATKTISIDMEAYERLRRARRDPAESFSRVIKRAEWPTPQRTAGGLLEALARAPTLSGGMLDWLDSAQQRAATGGEAWPEG